LGLEVADAASSSSTISLSVLYQSNSMNDQEEVT